MATIIKLSPGQRPSAAQVREVSDAIKAGKVVAFPTDTVYGLGSSALIPGGWRRIYEIKGRPAGKPLPVLVHSTAAAKRWVEWTPAADLIATRFWPGAVTLVLRPTEEGRALGSPEQPTVAIRVPKHPLLLELIEACGLPWASTSANLSGRPSLADGEAVARDFSRLADLIIDAGRVGGVDSTVVDATQVPVRVLREGAVRAESVIDSLRHHV